MKPDAGKPFVVRLTRAFGYAARGVARCSRDRMFRCQLVAGVVALALGAFVRLSRVEWAILALTIGVVLALEAMNSAVEYVVDLVSPDYNELAGRAKDAAAGAVLVASLGAAAVGAIILGGRLFDRFLAH